MQFVDNDGEGSIASYIAGRAEGIHSNVEGNDERLSFWAEAKHASQWPNAAIAAPPGTPGAATIQMPRSRMKCRYAGEIIQKCLVFRPHFCIFASNFNCNV